jgi:hypothetical protein
MKRCHRKKSCFELAQARSLRIIVKGIKLV